MAWSLTAQGIEMAKFWRGVVHTVFWSYERGSWPYDIMVLTIVAFVLLTPRNWFHDQPQSVALGSAGVQMMSEDIAAHTRIYRLDAKVLPAEKRRAKSGPELERETHDILSRKIDDLQDRTFQVVQIDPVSDGDGSVLYYDITLRL
jgi:hypothetical protein